MKKVHAWGRALPWIAAMTMGCDNQPARVAEAPSDNRENASTSSNVSSRDVSSSGSGAAGRTAAVAGSSANAPVNEAGTGPTRADAGAADGGTKIELDGGQQSSGATQGEPQEPAVPTPVESPQIWGFGIGVSDVPAATEYFKDVMRVVVEKEAVKRDDWTETMLFSQQAPRGGRLSLMAFDDMRNTRNITAKLIWKVKETAAIDEVASSYPFYMKYLDVNYVMFEGPDRYIQEISNELDPEGGDVEDPYLVAVGFAVSDGEAARKFYTAIGMTDKSLGSYPITDPTGYGTVGEYSERYGEGRAIVLQTWSPARNAKDNPLKVVIAVPDANAMAEMVVAAGGTIVSQAIRSDLYDNRLLVVAKDLDGYILDLVE